MENGKHLKLLLITVRDPNPYYHDSYNVILIHKMLEEIEYLLGEIDTVEGQKMENRFSLYRKNHRKDSKKK